MRISTKTWSEIGSGIGLVIATVVLIVALLSSVAEGGGNTQVATGYLSVPNSCNFAISNTIVDFGTITPGTNTIGTGASGVNAITVTNTGFNPANVEIEGTSWTYSSYSFGVSNTVWNGYAANTAWTPGATPSATVNAEVRLTSSAVDTLLETQNSISQTNTIYLGASVPSGQAGSGASNYQQTISFVSVC